LESMGGRTPPRLRKNFSRRKRKKIRGFVLLNKKTHAFQKKKKKNGPEFAEKLGGPEG